MSGFGISGKLDLDSLHAAQGAEGRHNFRGPLGHLILAKRALVGLKSCAQQHGIFAGLDRATPENLGWNELLQLRYPNALNRGSHLFKDYFVGKDEGEVSLDCRILSQWRKPDGAQPDV